MILTDQAFEASQRQLRSLALLQQLQRQARAAEDVASLGFTVVNDSRCLLDYQQSALWIAQPTPKVVAVSGVVQLDAHAPYIVWLETVCRAQLKATASAVTPCAIVVTDLPIELQQDWQHWLPTFAVWVPLVAHGEVLGGWLLARDQAWQAGEIALLAELGDAYGYAWQALQPGSHWWRQWHPFKHWKAWGFGLAVVLLLPVKQSVLAPAEVIAAQPTVIRAPLEGVIDQFAVQPNQTVAAEQLLLTIENTDIANRLEVSRKALSVAEAEYRKTAQQAMFEAESKAELTVLKAKMDQHQAEVTYMAEQLARSQIHAPHSGVAIFSDVHDWLGRPVALGERILILANPALVELEMRVPVANFIQLADGADVVLFLNIDPEQPLDAQVYSVSYQAEPSASDIIAYRVKAKFTLSDDQTPPRIGLKGTAKLYGQRVSLFYYLFRRPLSEVRQWLGL